MARKIDTLASSLLNPATVETMDAWIESELLNHDLNNVLFYVRTYKNTDGPSSHEATTRFLEKTSALG
jgi:hypothetical protein